MPAEAIRRQARHVLSVAPLRHAHDYCELSPLSGLLTRTEP